MFGKTLVVINDGSAVSNDFSLGGFNDRNCLCPGLRLNVRLRMLTRWREFSIGKTGLYQIAPCLARVER